MSVVASSDRALRDVLNRRQLRVRARCWYCGSSLGSIYGNRTNAYYHYIGGHNGNLIPFLTGPVTITCPGQRCRKKYVASRANFDAAYRAALAKPESQRVLRLPYDLKTVARGEPSVGLNSPLIGR
jgi:hypothetical protein